MIFDVLTGNNYDPVTGDIKDYNIRKAFRLFFDDYSKAHVLSDEQKRLEIVSAAVRRVNLVTTSVTVKNAVIRKSTQVPATTATAPAVSSRLRKNGLLPDSLN